MSLESLQRALQAHVIDGDLAIAVAIDSTADVTAATRLRIYSNAYRLRLIEALQANYPVLAQLVGEELFARMAQEYLAVFPSQHYSIRWFGHRLAEFLSEFPDYRDQPCLAELAAWEWKIATAFDASDATLLTVNDLARVAPEDWPMLRFALHPSVQRIALTTNVAAIVKASANDEVLPTPALTQRSEWLIWRQDLIMRYCSLDATETAAVDAVMAGANFSVLCEAVAKQIDETLAPAHAAGLLKRWIADACLRA